ncbi:MAG TPA: hypothetical protein VKU94_02915 [Geobacterales bacterium]|nr:hypothetical protein [Geobacterales bacterium]
MLEIPGRPIPKSNIYKARVVGNRAVIYTTKELEQYEMMIGKIAEEAIPEILRGFHSLYLRVYSTKGRLIDIDNCYKALLDSLDNSKVIKRGKKEVQVCNTGIENDKYFQLLVGERIIVDKKEEERLEVIIAPYEGLFKFSNLIKKIYNLDDDYCKNLFLPYKEG